MFWIYLAQKNDSCELPSSLNFGWVGGKVGVEDLSAV